MVRAALLAPLLLVFIAEVVANAQPRANKAGDIHVVSPGDWPRLHLPDPLARQAARNALNVAWERLALDDCQRLLAAFNDQSGSPLALRLRALAVDPQTYLTMLVFMDGSRDTPCIDGLFAFTTPGSRVVRMCVDELKREWRENPEHAVARVIHEMLHTLGLGEDPPASAEITRRVFAACRPRRG
jgi:hypothetical protein